jgi:small subunit ribosomal protein S33
MSVPRARLLELMKVGLFHYYLDVKGLANPLQTQCQIFSSTYNPENVRAGNKVLRQRLRGSVLVQYYPPRLVTFKDLAKSFEPMGMSMVNKEEQDRLQKIEQ